MSTLHKLYKYGTTEVYKYFDGTEVVIPQYQNNAKVRGVWVSNVGNIDTPVMKNISSYQKHLNEMIETIASYNINLVIFQVRPSSDAFYKSELNPWSRYITGTEGKDPGFDVFEYFISLAKAKNIEVHAWMNPYRVSTNNFDAKTQTVEEFLKTLDPKNFARRHPEDLILDGKDKIILKPASNRVIQFVTDTIVEVVNNYEVTGVHIDDYFYPYDKIPVEREAADYELAKAENTELSFSDWRRSNVDKMISSIHFALNQPSTKRHVEFGISPFGIYRTHKSINEEGWERGSYHAPKVCECYRDLYSDVYKWMKEGWIDYVVPQIYFPFSRLDVTYHDLLIWWDQICQETKTKLYIGQALYQVGANDFWVDPMEIHKQMSLNCLYKTVTGTVFFTYRDLLKGKNPTNDQALEQLKIDWNK